MNKKLIIGFLVVLTLASQSAFAHIEEHMKARLRGVILQVSSDQISHQDFLATALDLYPELNNKKDRSDLEEFIAGFIAELNSARTFAVTDLSSVEGNWKFVNDNAIISIRGDSGTMSTRYGGCTEVIPLTLKQGAGKFELVQSGPMASTPTGCVGGSAPFPPNVTLDYMPEGNFLTLTWNAD